MFIVKVEALGQQWDVEIRENNTVKQLIAKLLQQVNIIPHPPTIVYIDGNKKEEDYPITSKYQTIHAELQQFFNISTFHTIIGEIKFKANYFGMLNTFVDYIYNLPTFQYFKRRTYNKEVIKIIVNGQKIPEQTYWHKIGQINDFKIEVKLKTFFFIKSNEGTNTQIKYDICDPIYLIIEKIRKKLHIEGVIQLIQNGKKIFPDNLAKDELIPNSYYSIQQPDFIKYKISTLKVEFKVKIHKDDPISILKQKVAGKLKINQNQKFQLTYRGINLDENVCLQMIMIPCNSVLICELLSENTIILQLKNLETNLYQQLEVDAKLVLRELDQLLAISIEENQEIIYLLDNKQLDKNDTIKSLELKQSQFLIFKMVNKEQPLQNWRQQQIQNQNTIASRFITVGFQNAANDYIISTQVQLTQQIKEFFLQKIIAKQVFNELYHYSIIYKGAELDPNQTYQQAEIIHDSLLLYTCLYVNVLITYNLKRYETKVKRDTKLIFLENQFRVEYNVPTSHTIFHSQLENRQQTTIHEINIFQFEFKVKDDVAEDQFEPYLQTPNLFKRYFNEEPGQFQPILNQPVIQNQSAQKDQGLNELQNYPQYFFSFNQQIQEHEVYNPTLLQNQNIPQQGNQVKSQIKVQEVPYVPNLQQNQNIPQNPQITIQEVPYDPTLQQNQNIPPQITIQEVPYDPTLLQNQNIPQNPQIRILEVPYDPTFQQNQNIPQNPQIRIQEVPYDPTLQQNQNIPQNPQITIQEVPYDPTFLQQFSQQPDVSHLRQSRLKLQQQILDNVSNKSYSPPDDEVHHQQQPFNSYQQKLLFHSRQQIQIPVQVTFNRQTLTLFVSLMTTISELKKQLQEAHAFMQYQNGIQYGLYHSQKLLSDRTVIGTLKNKYDDILLLSYGQTF